MPRILSIDDFVRCDWHVQKRIVEVGATHHFDGQLNFVPRGNGYMACETGQIRLATGAILQSQQTYLWNRHENGVAIKFSDGRAFHIMDLRETIPQADHWCEPDMYQVRYDFTNWPNWQCHWHVKGPRKAYEMTVMFTMM